MWKGISSWFSPSPTSEEEIQKFYYYAKSKGWGIYGVSKDEKSFHQYIIDVVSANADIIEILPEFLLSDEEVIMCAVRQKGGLLEYALGEARNNFDVVLMAVQQDGLAIRFLADSSVAESFTPSLCLLKNKDIVTAAVVQNGKALMYVPELFRNDHDIVLAAISSNYCALEFASIELCNNHEIVFTAVKRDWKALEFASNELRNDCDVVLAALEQDGRALEFASDGLRNNVDIVLAAVKQDGRALAFASVELQNDPNIVLSAISQNGKALAYASQEKRNDMQIVTRALAQHGCALQFVSKELIEENNELIHMALNRNGEALRYVPHELRTREVMITALAQNGQAISHVLKKDRELCLLAVKQNGLALAQIEDMNFYNYRNGGGCVNYRTDPEISKTAIMQNAQVLTLDTCFHYLDDSDLVLKSLVTTFSKRKKAETEGDESARMDRIKEFMEAKGGNTTKTLCEIVSGYVNNEYARNRISLPHYHFLSTILFALKLPSSSFSSDLKTTSSSPATSEFQGPPITNLIKLGRYRLQEVKQLIFGYAGVASITLQRASDLVDEYKRINPNHSDKGSSLPQYQEVKRIPIPKYSNCL